MHKERNYDFRKRLLQIHRKDLRDAAILPNENELVLDDGWWIVMPADADEITETVAKDFQDYLYTSMNLSAMVTKCAEKATEKRIVLGINTDLGEHSVSRGYRITVEDEVRVEGFDSKGIAQGLYHLEDVMNLRLAPYLPRGVRTHHPLLDTRSTLSGYGADMYPDAYLSRLAHLGITSIGLWVYDTNETQTGFLDFNELHHRASKYGIDLGVQFFTYHSVHPDEPGAQEFYDKMYGDLFAKCPYLKSLCLVGEACQFSSRDPRAGKSPDHLNSVDGIPTGKRAPGWYPCSDWPDLVRMVQKAVVKHRPDVDIVFCSYNWGWAPEEDRVKLIENLPDGVSVSSTWEMFEPYEINGTHCRVADYTIRIPGPGAYFTSEAKACKKRGLRSYAIFNGTGRTWDFGAIPYMPAPYQWIQRYENMRKAAKDWGVCGASEAHHYGVYPSFITDLEKWALTDPGIDLQDVLLKLLASYFGRENVDTVDRAMRLWSEAFTHITPTAHDQYGAFRIGPAYPFWTTRSTYPPQNKFAMYKLADMYTSRYMRRHYGTHAHLRTPEEIKELEQAKQLFYEGLQVLETIPNPNEELARLINMGWFMYRTTITGIHAKEYFLVLNRYEAPRDRQELCECVDEMERILMAERENAEATIPLVEFDSVLGFEPSMEYVCDRAALEWKLRQVDYELEWGPPGFRRTECNM
ncbi:MAG: hypothetical protein IJA11_07410 [Oscillospiraceae bacterium]|nr:hypothetical protein [Oscillospiraceae bacterium]